MKLTGIPGAIVGALILAGLLFGAGYFTRAHQDRVALHRADSTAAVRLASQRAAAHQLDSLLAASQAADSARRAEDDRRVAAAQTHAAQLGTAAASLNQVAVQLAGRLSDARASGTVLALVDSAFVVQLERVTRELGDSLTALTLAIAGVQRADSSRHAHDVARIDSLQTFALPALQGQRDTALDREQAAIARAIVAERGWSPLRRIVTAASCALAGIGAAKKNAALGLGGGAVCAGSFVLR